MASVVKVKDKNANYFVDSRLGSIKNNNNKLGNAENQTVVIPE